MAVGFTVDSRFNKDAQFKRVTFGGDGKLVEAELNELQDIQNFRIQQLATLAFGNRPLYVGTYVVASGKLNITNDWVVVDGELIFVPSTSYSVAIGDVVYLNKIETTLTYTDAVKKGGDLSSSVTVPNQMYDTRIGEETTRRIQVTYQLTKTATGTGTFTKLCDIVDNGAGQPTVKQVTYIESPLFQSHANDNSLHTPYVVVGGSSNAYTATIPGATPYKKGFSLRIEIPVNLANTGASTLNVNSQGAKSIKRANGLALDKDSFVAGGVYELTYNGTDLIIQGDGFGSASVTKPGAVQLYDDVDSQSKTLAPTANAVKIAYDKAKGTRADSTTALVAEVRTSDPASPVNGQIWFRSDL